MKLHQLHIGNIYLTAPRGEDYVDFELGEPAVIAPNIDPERLETDRQLVLKGLQQAILSGRPEAEKQRD